uniref:Reverse transcriptase domain-containing protein n=1 Tax=Tanacetum cinerariifolium TaxID=118510 RepID=A0A6L2LK64_TANCI|nr:hypothetical protein [Tanacetum cinerariifolium]
MTYVFQQYEAEVQIAGKDDDVFNGTSLKKVSPNSAVGTGDVFTMPVQEVQSSLFASVLQSTQTKQSVKIKELRNNEVVAGAQVVIPLSAVQEGRNEYARALFEVSADEELQDSMVIDIPLSDGKGHSLATIDIEYEWKSPRCSTCKIFDHTNDGCPKNPKVAKVSSGTNDGFMEVKKKKNMSKQHRHIEVASDQFKVNKVPVSGPKTSVSVTNSFSALAENMENEIEWGIKDKWNKDAYVLNESDSEEEATYVIAYNEALILQERFLKQKAKIQRLKEVDANSAYFYKAVKSRVSRSRINVVTNSDGILFENEQVPKVFIDHYEVFLSQARVTQNLNTHNLFDVMLDEVTALNMIRNVSAHEDAWDIVGNDVVNAVGEFFTNDNLLKELNHTVIALILKTKNPSRVNDYRPISCCNVLFKCISKIIANRIKESLKKLISPNQSAFVSGRSISDNISLTQKLMHNYHLDWGFLRCAFKVDIQKAYDTVDWDFLKLNLTCFGFHERMVAWIMECGDPLSPYLFTIVMEVLTLILRRRVRESNLFSYHCYCSKMELVNLCFADDLFLFTHGDIHSARTIMEALDEFKLVSGLVPSLPESTAYFCNVLNHTKLAILEILLFEEGHLLVKYLGVPLVSSRLFFKDCKELIENVKSRINDWKNKSLLIAGGMSRGKAKVTWDVVCLPKDEGALVGDGSRVSLWYDQWCRLSPLEATVSSKDMYRVGLTTSSMVKDVFHEGVLVWRRVKDLGGFLTWLLRLTRSVIAKLVVAASAYFIWKERNSRLFKKSKRSEDHLVECITSSIRLKLISCRFKKSRDGLALMRHRKISDSVLH